MDRNLMSGLALAATATMAVVLAAAAPDNAYADDISVDTTPFTSTRTRAEIQSELFSQAALVRSGASEWALQSDPALKVTGASTREQAKSEYKASRSVVSAMLGEDSGSAYFMKSAPSSRASADGAATMGGPAR